MEISVQQLIGLNVYSLEQGEKIGQVREYLLDNKGKELVALIISARRLKKEENLICLTDVSGLSPEAVTVDSPAVLRKKSDCPHLKDLIRTAPTVEGLSVLKKDGTFLGRASAVHVNSETGKISRIELNHGTFLSNLGKGRCYISAADIEIIGSDMILAKEDAEIREYHHHTPSAMKAKVKQHMQSKTESGCGEKIMAMSGKIPLPRRRTIFPEIPKDDHEEKDAEN